jgi:hypothetical protein
MELTVQIKITNFHFILLHIHGTIQVIHNDVLFDSLIDLIRGFGVRD